MEPSFKTKFVHTVCHLFGKTPICSKVFNETSVRGLCLNDSLRWMEATPAQEENGNYQLFICEDYSKWRGALGGHKTGLIQTQVFKEDGGKFFTKEEVVTRMKSFEETLIQSSKTYNVDGKIKVFQTNHHIATPTFAKYQLKS